MFRSEIHSEIALPLALSAAGRALRFLSLARARSAFELVQGTALSPTPLRQGTRTAQGRQRSGLRWRTGTIAHSPESRDAGNQGIGAAGAGIHLVHGRGASCPS